MAWTLWDTGWKIPPVHFMYQYPYHKQCKYTIPVHVVLSLGLATDFFSPIGPNETQPKKSFTVVGGWLEPPGTVTRRDCMTTTAQIFSYLVKSWTVIPYSWQSRAHFHQHGLTHIRACLSNYISCFKWDVITHPCLNSLRPSDAYMRQ